MPNYNSCMFVGHLTRDPETKYLQDNTAVVNGGIAITTRYAKDKERTCFLDFVLFGTRAEAFAKYTAKGDAIMLIGELEYQQWEKDGQKRSKHALRVNDFVFMPKRDGEQEQAPPRQGQRQPPAMKSRRPMAQVPQDDEPGF